MSSRRHARVQRRIAARQRAREGAHEAEQPDERQAERRVEVLTPEQLDARLRQLGIAGDRRSGRDRRSGSWS